MTTEGQEPKPKTGTEAMRKYREIYGDTRFDVILRKRDERIKDQERQLKDLIFKNHTQKEEIQKREIHRAEQKRIVGIYEEALNAIKDRKQYSCECVGEECSCDFSMMQSCAEDALSEARKEQ